MDGYYTREDEEPAVYHVLRYCPAGERIRKSNRARGEVPVVGRRVCHECEGLARKWILNLPRS
jgi:hypothetical protein